MSLLKIPMYVETLPFIGNKSSFPMKAASNSQPPKRCKMEFTFGRLLIFTSPESKELLLIKCSEQFWITYIIPAITLKKITLSCLLIIRNSYKNYVPLTANLTLRFSSISISKNLTYNQFEVCSSITFGQFLKGSRSIRNTNKGINHVGDTLHRLQKNFWQCFEAWMVCWIYRQMKQRVYFSI